MLVKCYCGMILLYLYGGLVLLYSSICFGDQEQYQPIKKSLDDYLLTPAPILYNGKY